MRLSVMKSLDRCISAPIEERRNNQLIANVHRMEPIYMSTQRGQTRHLLLRQNAKASSTTSI